jgi:hypothetical protein
VGLCPAVVYRCVDVGGGGWQRRRWWWRKGRVDWFELMSRTGIGVANRFHSTRQGS